MSRDTTAAGNAQGGRNKGLPDASGAVAGLPKIGGLGGGLGGISGNSNDNTEGTTTETKTKAPEGFGLDNGKDVKGSLKVHISKSVFLASSYYS